VGTARTDYWYDSTGMSLETSATGGGNATYLREPGGGLVSVTSGTRFQNHFTDRQGTVTATVNGYGNLVNTYRYDPYGSSVGTTGTVYNEYRYAGTYREPALGMYLMGARYGAVHASRPASEQRVRGEPVYLHVWRPGEPD